MSALPGRFSRQPHRHAHSTVCQQEVKIAHPLGVTLGRDTVDLMASVPHTKCASLRAEVYTRREVEAILTTPSQPPEQVFLMAVYACGLRISEATQLKTSDIDRTRMQLRVRNGKGAKECVLLIEPKPLR
jgi:site-specific recombinase XerD